MLDIYKALLKHWNSCCAVCSHRKSVQAQSPCVDLLQSALLKTKSGGNILLPLMSRLT